MIQKKQTVFAKINPRHEKNPTQVCGLKDKRYIKLTSEMETFPLKYAKL